MRPTFEHLTPAAPLTWRYAHFMVGRLDPYWHFHREFELTRMVRGRGTRLAGDSVEEYQSGDLALFGPDLPHCYVSTGEDMVNEAVVIHFRRDFLGDGLFDTPAFENVAAMLDDAANGIWFPDPPEQPDGLGTLPAAERSVELLRLLVTMSRVPYRLLATEQRRPAVSRAVAGRVEAMVAKIHAGYASPLALKDIAGAASMNASAASRLFARCTGSSVTRYLTVVRLNAACRSLRETDRPVATIATESGFTNLSNFNRRFRAVKGMSPSAYRAHFRAGRTRT
ncbi:helix-turn-helix domain-containing protein [Amycolatopsis suaedae]|uniref:AraC family transcriptional regulator n=1 Tax=Amycolatopsis suaedae TaxID=2510978 RepID=A0A4Q7J1Z7_9PSEU|nr:AraC family transcriptional regulator [Amycolatopsis suaedae]RZQ61450.1 AraC family transcriptional regulator [Amycolatopsis suaedae]